MIIKFIVSLITSAAIICAITVSTSSIAAMLIGSNLQILFPIQYYIGASFFVAIMFILADSTFKNSIFKK